MLVLFMIGLFISVNAATLKADSPFGPINLQVQDGIKPPPAVVMPGATPMSGSFPVYYDDGNIRAEFRLYYSDGVTMQDIIDFLVWFFF